MLNRRQLLKVGAASMVVTGLGVGYFAATRRPDNALLPWNDDAHAYDDIRLKALSYAVLAPNPHNRQPWLADLSIAGEVNLLCDLDKRLPETDPFDRQITIGLGCFVGLFELAANHFGYRVIVDEFPQGESTPRLDGRVITQLKMVEDKGAPQSKLFEQIKRRRSNKEPYDTMHNVSEKVIAELIDDMPDGVEISGVVNPAKLAALRDLTWRAYLVEALTPRTMQESIDLMRIGKAEINANPDGIDLGGPMLELLAHVGMLDRAQLADQNSTAFQQGLDMYRGLMFSAMGYVWVTTPDNSRRSQLAAGRAWVMLNLKAAKLGVGVHPLSQALQEYKEMRQVYSELHEMLAVDAPKRIQMFGRIGYGPETPPSPRWAVENCLLNKV
ncbi:Acg family FMN-binding oxidoreductase [Kordiimonas aquimaris]|uniref:Acg family FMN-binding oxidoreductase n=1 Tax=Kordiimonas aquimaris TaxID=707591 RepID=UPI0021D2C4A6|nr:hypothetical protein [Kordiimonas aquimaris]